MSLSEINREKRLYVGSILKRRNAIALLTCDKAFLFSGVRESVEARELAVGRREKKKKRTPDTITGRVICRPLFAYVMFSCVILLK